MWWFRRPTRKPGAKAGVISISGTILVETGIDRAKRKVVGHAGFGKFRRGL